jgi:predicted Zn-dependent protease
MSTFNKALSALGSGDPGPARRYLQNHSVKNPKERERFLVVAKAFSDIGAHADAEKALLKVLKWAPSDLPALNNLAALYLRAKRYADCENVLLRGLSAYPDSLPLKANLGACKLRLEQTSEATKILEAVVARAPDQAAFQELLATALYQAGQFPDALTHYLRALELDPKLMVAYANASRLIFREGNAATAAQLIQQGLQAAPEDLDCLIWLTELTCDAGQLDTAERSAMLAVKTHPLSLGARMSLASVYRSAGRMDDAREVLRHVPLADSASPEFLILAAELELREMSVSDFQKLDAYVQRGIGPWKQLARSAAILAGRFGRDAAYDKEIEYLHIANAFARKSGSYDAELARSAFRGIEIAAKGNLDFESMENQTQSSAPIFIVGMPRSGTTLVEQILFSHPDVEALGETDAFSQAMRAVEDEVLSSSSFARLAEGYLERIARMRHGPEAQFTDKQVFNYQYVGEILTAFPHARIVCCHRHPVDNCLGIYRQIFADKSMSFSFSLEDIAEVYIAFTRYMLLWEERFPGRIHHLHYETLVDNFEQEARRLLAFVNLTWDPACLTFHTQKRQARTASQLQVHQPLYRSAVGRWKRYKDFLPALLEQLKAAGVAL